MQLIRKNSRAPQRTSAYIPQQNMKSVQKCTKSSKEDFCLYSLLHVHGTRKEIDQELEICLYSLLKIYEISKGRDQDLQRQLILIFLSKNVQNQWGNTLGAPQRNSIAFRMRKTKTVGKCARSSTEDLCLYSSLTMYVISKAIDREIHRGLILILLIGSVWNQ